MFITESQANNILDMVGSVFREVGAGMNTSGLWVGMPLVFTASDLRVNLKWYLGNNYGAILDSTPITPKMINNNKASLMMDIFYPSMDNRALCSVHYHGGKHSGLELQKGRNHQPITCIPFDNLGTLGSSFFLQNQKRGEIIEKIILVVNGSESKK